jgi:hypothetical protein
MPTRLPLLQAKSRTAETYLAGIGASGALMASAFVLFIVLVGVVTFNAWPHPGQLLNGGGGNVSLQDVPLANQAPPPPAPTPNLVALLGGPASAAAVPASNRGGGGNGGATTPSRGSEIGSGNVGATSPGTGSGNGGGGGPQTTTIPPSSPTIVPDVTRTGGLGDLVAGVGNNLQSDTNSLGDSLGGSNSTLGGLVQGLGTTLNNTLQQLSGTP